MLDRTADMEQEDIALKGTCCVCTVPDLHASTWMLCGANGTADGWLS